jgi:hypothetical protein
VGDSLTADDVAALSTYPEIVGVCAAVIFVAAVFGRTRFKEGRTQLRKGAYKEQEATGGRTPSQTCSAAGAARPCWSPRVGWPVL